MVKSVPPPHMGFLTPSLYLWMLCNCVQRTGELYLLVLEAACDIFPIFLFPMPVYWNIYCSYIGSNISFCLYILVISDYTRYLFNFCSGLTIYQNKNKASDLLNSVNCIRKPFFFNEAAPTCGFSVRLLRYVPYVKKTVGPWRWDFWTLFRK